MFRSRSLGFPKLLKRKMRLLPILRITAKKIIRVEMTAPENRMLMILFNSICVLLGKPNYCRPNKKLNLPAKLGPETCRQRSFWYKPTCGWWSVLQKNTKEEGFHFLT